MVDNLAQIYISPCISRVHALSHFRLHYMATKYVGKLEPPFSKWQDNGIVKSNWSSFSTFSLPFSCPAPHSKRIKWNVKLYYFAPQWKVDLLWNRFPHRFFFWCALFHFHSQKIELIQEILNGIGTKSKSLFVGPFSLLSCCCQFLLFYEHEELWE